MTRKLLEILKLLNVLFIPYIETNMILGSYNSSNSKILYCYLTE